MDGTQADGRQAGVKAERRERERVGEKQAGRAGCRQESRQA